MSDTATEATEPITAEQRDEWARLEEEATPGPWHVLLPTEEGKPILFVRVGTPNTYPIAAIHLYAKDTAIPQANAVFIAAARVAVPALLAALQKSDADLSRANKENARLQAALSAMCEIYEQSLIRRNALTRQIREQGEWLSEPVPKNPARATESEG